MIWQALIAVGQQLLIQQAKRLIIPTTLNNVKSLASSVKHLSKQKGKYLIKKGISAATNLVPTPFRSSLNYTLKSNINRIEWDASKAMNLIKSDIKKSLYNQLVPSKIKFMISIYRKADNWIDKKIKQMERQQRKDIKDRIKALNRMRMETKKRMRELHQEIIRMYKEEIRLKQATIRFNRWLHKQILKDMKEREKLFKQTFQQAQKRLKEYRRNITLYEKNLLNLTYQENNNLHYKDFFDFLDTLSNDERKRVVDLIHDHTGVLIAFNSSWIKSATWTPLFTTRDYSKQVEYLLNGATKTTKNKIYSNSASGILQIIIKKKFKSKNNPKRLYAWYNVSFGTWKKIIAIKNGKNFWSVFYRQARVNRRYITNDSKYYKYDRSLQYKANRRYKRNPRQEDYSSY